MQEHIRLLTVSSQQGQLPSQTENNPKQLHAVTLRSGLILPEREKEAVVEQREKIDPNQGRDSASYDLSIDQYLGSTRPHHLPKGNLAQQYKSSPRATTSSQPTRAKEKSTPEVRFPYPAAKPVKEKKADEEAEILSMFSKIAVNIPMLTLISKVPSYAKFLK